LLLLHGNEAICSEYIPSKLYEYLWMQRPILASVHQNRQMGQMLRTAGHEVVEYGEDMSTPLSKLVDRWELNQLSDSGSCSGYTTKAAVDQLIGWVQ
jgi:hypothetical protein